MSSDGLNPDISKVIRLLSMASASYLHQEYTDGDRELVKSVLTRIKSVLDEWEKNDLFFDPATLQVLLDSLVTQFAGAHLAVRGIINSLTKPDERESEST